MNAIIEENMHAIESLCQKHHVKTLYAFGSVTGSSFNAASDFDFLYEFEYGNFDIYRDSFDNIPFDPFVEFFELKDSLQKLLQREIDLFPKQKFRNQIFNKHVEQTKVLIYGGERYQEVPA
jgi:predicted nucleotidyltransferase